MRFVIDIHLHSSYSRATSRDLVPENLHRWSCLKGLDVVGTGDFTHPAWLGELKDKLEPAEDGLYRLKSGGRALAEEGLFPSCRGAVRFALSVEISLIYKKAGKTRKIHNLVLLPSFAAVDRLNRRLAEIGNLKSDGRPILGLDSRDLVEIALEASPDALFIPAHIWTPHFSLFGSQSGFDAFETCFEDMSPYIYAVETGLSSDPAMNSRLSVLDRFSIVSNSDAHSPQKLGREATCFDTDLSYFSILDALKDRSGSQLTGTLEFFPEEGKYHCDGHRSCGVCWRPSETRSALGVCPVCGKPVTVGVLHRVEALADRLETPHRRFERLIPLPEIIASAVGVGPSSRKVEALYVDLLRIHGPELKVLRETPVADLEQSGHPHIAEGIRRMRAGEVDITPGYDGVYGKIRVFRPGEQDRQRNQATLLESLDKEGDRSRALPPGPSGGRTSSGDGTGIDGQGAPGNGGKGRAESPGSTDHLIHKERPGGSRNPTLDLEQAAATAWEHGPVAVTAGPGTGKTFVLTHRIAKLVREHGVDPCSIVAVTFTNRAAREIQHRLDQMLPEGTGHLLKIGTFHRLCRDLLQRHDQGKGWTVIDPVEARAGIQDVLRSGHHRISLAEACDQVASAKMGSMNGAGCTDPAVGSILAGYQAWLLRHRLWDFDDLLINAVSLLESNREALERVGQEVRHLLVDEFQDVNPVQYQLVRLLAGDGRNLFVIGDPNQAIYGFRGADPRYFSQLCVDFPGTKSFILRKNRRSTGQILRLAGGTLSGGGITPGSTIPTREHGVPVRLLASEDETAEGVSISREIARQVGGLDLLEAGRGSGAWRGFSDFAVLFRIGRQSLAIEAALSAVGIPYRLIGQKGFLDAGPVRDVLAFLRYTTMPDDAFRLHSVLRTAVYNAGEQILALIPQPDTGDGRLLEWVRGASARIAGKAGDRVRKFVSDVDTYLDQASRVGMVGAVASWCARNGLADSEDVVRLLEVCGQHPTAEALFRDVLAGHDADCEQRAKGSAKAGEAVSLLTLHASKGMEFPVVFIAGVEDGLIPFRGREEDLEEERRLFYVGVTRGRDEVILTSARRRRRYGLEVRTAVSPFVRNLEEGLLQVERRGRRRREEQLALF